MRRLGERNLEICKTLHDATLRFFERHFRKLRRHTEALRIEGVSNFLHIFLSMGGLLRTQIERTVIGLDARSFATAQEWGDCRDLWDVYFLKFRELMECLWNHYLQPLSLDCTREDLLEEFGQDLQALHELCDAMIRYRERIEEVRTKKCVSSAPSGHKIPFGYFRSVLEPIGWQRYASGVQEKLQRIDETVLGPRHHQPSPLNL